MAEEWISFSPSPDQPSQPAAAGWKLAIIDDDQAVHDGTRFALQNFRLGDRSLELLGAHSGSEGLELLRRNPDTAVVLLDVVMETEDAGLRLARRIRKELGNELVRIILRTGQPGQAPEHTVVVDYDINDYKAKTELTAEKLFATLTSALRSYEQLRKLDDMRLGLEMIVQASSDLFDDRSLSQLAHGVLLQLNALLSLETAGILVLREAENEDASILASLGSFRTVDLPAFDLPSLFARMSRDGPILHDGFVHLYVRTGRGSEILVILDTDRELTQTQISLVTVFSAKLGVAFDNAQLYERLREAHDTLEGEVLARTADLRQANERLEAQSLQLKRVNAFKNEILGTVAHDLKNPLAVILGRAEMLGTLVESFDEDEREPLDLQIDQIRTAARRMTRIVDMSVSDAMADAMDIAIARRPVDIAQVVRTAADLNGHLAGMKDQALVVLMQQPTLPAVCDPDRLAEAVDNLLSNAVKYTPAGGRIELAAGMREDAVWISVWDSGPGLKPEDLVRLFGRFQRLSAQPTGGESSTGLGLSIVHKIVELHDGRIDVLESGPLGGASFTISLPRSTGLNP